MRISSQESCRFLLGPLRRPLGTLCSTSFAIGKPWWTLASTVLWLDGLSKLLLQSLVNAPISLALLICGTWRMLGERRAVEQLTIEPSSFSSVFPASDRWMRQMVRDDSLIRIWLTLLQLGTSRVRRPCSFTGHRLRLSVDGAYN